MTNVEYKHTQIAVKKNFGQNFLTDRNITRKIVALSGASADDNILEIGPGFGALTKELLTLCPTFTVVEKDNKLAAFIREEYPQLHLIAGDFLETDLAALAKEKPLRVFGNIPYSITSPILFKLLEARRSMRSAMLMMQHEVAQRLVAPPNTKEYGILAVQMQAFCTVEYLFKVGRKVFRPQPNVDSAVIQITPKAIDPVADADGFRRFIRTAFHQRRKTLHNNLKEQYDTSQVEHSTLQRRAESLSIDELIVLFSLLKPLHA